MKKHMIKHLFIWNVVLLMTQSYADLNFDGCSGSGTFEQQIESYNGDYNKSVYVGEIPKGIQGLHINLISDKDVDIRLYGDNNDKIVHWPYGILSFPREESKAYKNVTITYSGFNGVGGKKGNEYITIAKTTPTKMRMEAFGYEAGYATVNYSWTGKEGCSPKKAGTGDFTQNIKAKETSLVGTIPPHIKDVTIQLTSDKDLDIQLYGADGTAIVSWEPKGLLFDSAKQEIDYHGMHIEWSGYYGVNGQKGNEYIKITGTTSEMLVMKVYGYEAGSAEVHYSWGKDAVENALTSGSVKTINEETLLAATIKELEDLKTIKSSLLKTIYKNETIQYDPGRRTQLIEPLVENLYNIYPILQGNKGYALAALGVKRNSRFAVFGSTPLWYFEHNRNMRFEPQFKRILFWLMHGDLIKKRTIGLSFLDSNKKEIKAWIEKNYPKWSIKECDSHNPDFTTCYNNVDLILTGREADNKNVQSIVEALQKATTSGIPILYFHTNTEQLNKISAHIANELGFTFVYLGNYWKRDKADWNNYESMKDGIGLDLIETLLKNIQKKSYSFDWEKCAKKGIRMSCAQVPGVPKFEAALRNLKHILGSLDRKKIDIFSSSKYRLQKLLILLGDKFRESVTYPMDKIKTDDTEFIKSFYADNAVYNYRKINPTQPDMGNFSRSDFSNITPITKTIQMTSRIHFCAAGLYALPGKTMKITRNDHSDLTVKVFINSLRSTATHEYATNSYNRPKYLQTEHYVIEPGESIMLTSAYGGPIQLEFSKNDLAVNIKFEQVGEHPYWESTADNDSFKKKLEANEYDWAEIATAGFTIHSKIDKMKESISDPKWGGTAEGLAKAVVQYTSNYPHVLSGVKGKGVDVVPEIHDWAEERGITIATIDLMKHMNADQATCGYGCSGNPYDAYWEFGPIRHGDIHEMGHSMQMMRFDGFPNHAATNTFSYYTKSRYFENTGEDPDCQGLPFKTFFQKVQSAVGKSDVTAYLKTHLWDKASLGDRYLLKIEAMMHAQKLGKVKNGWHVLARVHMLQREMRRAKKDWETRKTAVGFSTYSLNEINKIGHNDWLVVAYSYVAQVDFRDYFDMVGIPYSKKAREQIATFGFEKALKTLFVSTNTGYCKEDKYGRLLDKSTLPIDGTTSFTY